MKPTNFSNNFSNFLEFTEQPLCSILNTEDRRTNDPVSLVTATQVEDVILVAVVSKVIRLYLQRELLHEGTRVASLSVWVSVPCLLLYR